jgi:hypothetical protein
MGSRVWNPKCRENRVNVLKKAALTLPKGYQAVAAVRIWPLRAQDS